MITFVYYDGCWHIYGGMGSDEVLGLTEIRYLPRAIVACFDIGDASVMDVLVLIDEMIIKTEKDIFDQITDVYELGDYLSDKTGIGFKIM